MMEKVYVVYQNKIIVGIYSTQKKATDAMQDICDGKYLSMDVSFVGPLKLSMEIYDLDCDYHSGQHLQTMVKPTHKRRGRPKKEKSTSPAIEGQAPKKRGRPKKIIEPIAPVETFSVDEPVKQDTTKVRGRKPKKTT